MKKIFVSIFFVFLFHNFSFSQTEKTKKDSLSSEEKIFNVVEEYPSILRECAFLKESKEDALKCSGEKILEYIYSNIKYPPLAIQNKIEGTVILKIFIEKDGSISEVHVLREIGYGCGKEAKKVLLQMHNTKKMKWVPGSSRGNPVKNWFIIPVAFKLNSNDSQKN